MTTIIELEQKITAAFRGGELRTRELRLTSEEADYIRARYPALVTPMGPAADRSWYEITFRGVEN